MTFFYILLLISALIVFLLYKVRALRKQNQELRLKNESLEFKIELSTNDLDEAQRVGKIGFWVYNILEDKLRWSDYTYEMFEVVKNDDENLYEILFEKTHPEDIKKVKDAYYASIKDMSKYSVEHRIVMSSGEVKYVSELGETKYSPEGIALVTYGTTQDITQRVLAQESLQKKDAFMFHQSRLAQMGEMLSMIAHQWRQPLNAISVTQVGISTILEVEKYDLSDEKEREIFLDILNERLEKIALYVENLSKTIDDFSNFYKPNNNGIDLGIDELVLKSFDIIKDSIDSLGISVKFDLSSSLEVEVYENEFMQVVLSLLNNAQDQLVNNKVKDAVLIIRTREDENSVMVEVEDNAGGVKENIIDNLFEPYFSTKMSKNGTGLGLYMAKMIITEHHLGDISVRNGREGAIFKITVPKKGKRLNDI